jgi:putative FmdB family regulatory protein
MPIYEYICESCDCRFDLLVRGNTVLECPQCESDKLARQISAFAVGSTTKSSAPRPQAACEDCPNAGGCSAGA